MYQLKKLLRIFFNLICQYYTLSNFKILFLPKVKWDVFVSSWHVQIVALEQHSDVALKFRAVDQPDDEQIRDRIVRRIAVPSESDVSVEALGSFAATLIDGEPEVLARALADVHHAADPVRAEEKYLIHAPNLA